jgi:hypothetical protein
MVPIIAFGAVSAVVDRPAHCSMLSKCSGTPLTVVQTFRQSEGVRRTQINS